MTCDPKKALVYYDSKKSKDPYTIFMCKDVFMASKSKLIGKFTTKDIQPCSCLGTEISFSKLPPTVQAALLKRAK